MKNKVDYICTNCNSYEIVWDAYAFWDAENQEMVLSQSFDQSECCECGSENIDEVPYNKEEK